jgi:hypothetical protein
MQSALICMTLRMLPETLDAPPPKSHHVKGRSHLCPCIAAFLEHTLMIFHLLSQQQPLILRLCILLKLHHAPGPTRNAVVQSLPLPPAPQQRVLHSTH